MRIDRPSTLPTCTEFHRNNFLPDFTSTTLKTNLKLLSVLPVTDTLQSTQPLKLAYQGNILLKIGLWRSPLSP